MTDRKRIAIVVSHPIQHFCPQYVSFARHSKVHIKVFFASALGYKKYVDPNFKQEVSWSNLQLDQFDHVFLNGENVLPADKHLDAPGLNKALEAYAPDVVILYGYFQQLQRRAHRWARKQGVKLAYISDSEKRQHRTRWKELLKYPFLRWYFSSIEYFLSVGNANEQFYCSYGVPDTRLIRMHFPIDVHSYKIAFDQKDILRQQIRAQYNIGEEEIVTAVVGKLVEWKNQDHIIDALQLLESEGVYFHLFIIGFGEEIEKWKEKAKTLTRSRVHFTGFVSIDVLPAYYAACDFYTHPASVEPHSIAISEAIYMGCPIVLSDRCGSYGEQDDVQEGKNGFVFPFGDINALAATIKKLCMSKELRKKMSDYSIRIAVDFQERSHSTVLNDLLTRLR